MQDNFKQLHKFFVFVFQTRNTLCCLLLRFVIMQRFESLDIINLGHCRKWECVWFPFKLGVFLFLPSFLQCCKASTIAHIVWSSEWMYDKNLKINDYELYRSSSFFVVLKMCIPFSANTCLRQTTFTANIEMQNIKMFYRP